MSLAGVIWVRKEGTQCGTIADFPVFPLNRESFRTFHELSEIFSDENNHSLSRELLIKVWGTCSPVKELGLVLAERSPLSQLPGRLGILLPHPKSCHCMKV